MAGKNNSNISKALKEKIRAKRGSGNKSERSEVLLSDLQDNPYQPRLAYDEEELSALSTSIKEKGLLQPIVVSKKNGDLVIVAGHRRKRACEAAGMKKVPAVILEGVEDKDLMLLAAAENVVRVDLDVIEEAKSYYDMIKNGISAKQIAKALGVSETIISRKKNLLHLSEVILEDIRLNNSTKDVTALTLLRKIKDKDMQEQAYFEFLKKGRDWLREEVKNCACAISDKSSGEKKNLAKKLKRLSSAMQKKEINKEIQQKINEYLIEIERLLDTK
jgi:ParB/RepB/Spo0J family partition protein